MLKIRDRGFRALFWFTLLWWRPLTRNLFRLGFRFEGFSIPNYNPRSTIITAGWWAPLTFSRIGWTSDDFVFASCFLGIRPLKDGLYLGDDVVAQSDELDATLEIVMFSNSKLIKSFRARDTTAGSLIALVSTNMNRCAITFVSSVCPRRYLSFPDTVGRQLEVIGFSRTIVRQRRITNLDFVTEAKRWRGQL